MIIPFILVAGAVAVLLWTVHSESNYWFIESQELKTALETFKGTHVDWSEFKEYKDINNNLANSITNRLNNLQSNCQDFYCEIQGLKELSALRQSTLPKKGQGVKALIKPKRRKK